LIRFKKIFLVAAVSLLVSAPLARSVAVSESQQSARNDLDNKRSRDCNRLFKRSITPLQELQRSLRPQLKMSALMQEIVSSDIIACNAEDAAALSPQIQQAFNHHSGKIGIILPLHGQNLGAANEVLNGFRMAFARAEKSFDQAVIVLDSGPTIASTEQALAELVLVHEVSVVVGGLQTYEATALSQWADRLNLTTILLNSRVDMSQGRQFSFSISPQNDILAAHLAQIINQRSYRQIAIVRTDRPSASLFAQSLSDALHQLQGVKVTHNTSYRENDFASMENAAKRIFAIDPSARQAEYRALLKRRKKQAQAAGLPMNLNTIMLPPKTNLDAVVIADNFRNVRHMARIFRSLGVKDIVLLGHHEWRSAGLLQPPEPMLENAVFVDYLGEYGRLPAGLSVTTSESPYFTSPQQANSLDYRLLSYLAASVGAQVNLSLTVPRRSIRNQLRNLASERDTFLQPGPIFDARQRLRWPSFAFTVRQNRLEPMPQFILQQPSPASKPGVKSAKK